MIAGEKTFDDYESHEMIYLEDIVERYIPTKKSNLVICNDGTMWNSVNKRRKKKVLVVDGGCKMCKYYINFIGASGKIITIAYSTNRIVAKAFVDIPDSLRMCISSFDTNTDEDVYKHLQVVSKDGVWDNNHYTNLTWVTHLDFHNHQVKRGNRWFRFNKMTSGFDVQLAIELLRSGHTVEEVHRQTKISKNILYAYSEGSKKRNIHGYRKGALKGNTRKHITTDKLHLICQLLTEGWAVDDIEGYVGLSEGLIRAVLNRKPRYKSLCESYVFSGVYWGDIDKCTTDIILKYHNGGISNRQISKKILLHEVFISKVIRRIKDADTI